MTARHVRTFGDTDGITDDTTAVAWADHETANRRAGATGKHRA